MVEKRQYPPLYSPQKQSLGVKKIIWRYIVSGFIVSLLIFIVINFYVFSSIVSIDTFLLIFLTLTILTDGLLLLVQVLQRPSKDMKYHFDPKKVSVVISTYNGAAFIKKTIHDVLKRIPRQQIIVVSDGSTDNTVQVVKRMGIKVLENKNNLNKAFSVSVGVYKVKTPFVLLLDDDVLIGNAVIPTSLLDDGYSAVAFNVLPIKTDTLVNALQLFEYRVSMYIGKLLRTKNSAVGNVSGAIGLYRTEDLKKQAYLHSGQFAGEDEQRTLLSHIYGSGKGVTYCRETVYTIVPNTLHALYRQRAYGWSLSVPELIPIYLRILFSVQYHHLLKAEKAYNLYIYLTDPLRLLFLWTLFLRPKYLMFTYGLYLILNTIMWLRSGRKDQFLVVLIYPFYSLILSIFRQIGNFYWLKVKFVYFRKKYHRLVFQRFIVAEAVFVVLVFVGIWGVSINHFMSEMRLFNKVKSARLEETNQNFAYEYNTSTSSSQTPGLNIPYLSIRPPASSSVGVIYEPGDTLRSIAHKAVTQAVNSDPGLAVPYEKRAVVDKSVIALLQQHGVYLNSSSSTLLIDSDALKQKIQATMEQQIAAK